MIQPKVAAAGVAGAVAVLIVGVLALFGVVLDPTVVSALTTLIAFAAGYIKKDTNASD